MGWARNNIWTDGEPTDSWKKIKQGSADNCALLAAISSHRWTLKTIPVTKVSAAGVTPRVYQVTLYYYPDDAGCTGVIAGDKVTISLYVNDYILWNTADFLWAQVDGTVTCMWPGLIEKAYADLCEFLYHGVSAHTDQANPLDQPTWDATPPPWDGGFHPLSHLKLCSEKNCVYSPTLTQIKLICGTNGKTKYPAIINSKSTQPSGSEVNFNHTYSLLGLYPATSNARYIVIRNPQRIGKSIKYISPDTKPPTNWLSQTLNADDGIMTVCKDDIPNWFDNVSYVKI